MKIGAQAHHTTSISTSNESVIVVRGRNLTDELIGRINFTDYFWLLLTGDLPSPQQRTVLDATLVAIAITSRLNSDNSMPGCPCVTPSHIAGTPPANCATAPASRAARLMSAG